MQRLKPGKKDNPPSRDHWEDPRPQFLDWVEKQGWEKTMLGRIVVDLEERLGLRRALFVFGFCLVLAILLFFPMRVPVDLRVGDTAKMDVSSPLSFEMIDEVTTEEKRMKVQVAVSDVYDYDPDVFGRVVSNIDKSFRNMRVFGREVKWPVSTVRRQKDLKPFLAQKAIFEKELQATVSEDLYEWLVDNRFSPRIENAVVRTLEDWYIRKIAALPDAKNSGKEELTARTLGHSGMGPETQVERADLLNLRDIQGFLLTDKEAVERFDEADRAHLLRLSRSLLQPNLTLNKAETEARKQKARNDVLPVNISVKKNQPIVSRGSIVQPFHMAVMKHIEHLQAERRQGLMSIALAVLLATAILVFASFQRRFGVQRLQLEFKDLSVMMLIALSQIFFTKLFLFIMDAAFLSRHSAWISADFVRALAPVAAAPMLVGLLLARGEVLWFFTAFMAVSMGMMEDFHFGFFLQCFFGGIAGARGVFNCKQRSDIYTAGLRAGAVNAVVLASLQLIMKSDQETSVVMVLLTIAGGFMGGILSSFITMMILPLLENMFNYTTDVRLLELSNLNHPLMKEMIIKAPGTYNHSIMVGNMVEAAAEEIGANPLLGKVMCYYHDIGKIGHPSYFIENQRPGHNPHDQITPYMSKTLLIAHVKDGVELGMRYKLGKPIIDGILQHHGTTLISYFYNKALDQKGEFDEVSEEDFRYPGPKPQFKEAALCMLADSIEAAARALDEPTPARLQGLVKNIIQKKLNDHQLDECNLTLKEIARIERAFVRILLGIYHQRIDYPKERA
ncbi:MAG: HDIG domain-containing protein [Bdellovibrionaceae bacterium]|nr:HDIG domain-containing protein [Pseudobdellovibrionaceae bacterium]